MLISNQMSFPKVLCLCLRNFRSRVERRPLPVFRLSHRLSVSDIMLPKLMFAVVTEIGSSPTNASWVAQLRLKCPFFFPSFASAAFARSSHSVCAGERISQVHEAASLLGESKEECGPLRSPKSCQADKRKTAQTKQTQKQTKHPKKSAPIKRQLRWGRQLMCQ